MNKKYWIALSIVLLQLIVALIIATQLSEDAKIPVHWNFQGEVDNYSGKWLGTLLFPLINAFILALLIAMPYISVRYKNSEKRFQDILPAFALILISCFALIHIFSLLLAANLLAENVKSLHLILGLMFLLLGNYLPKVPSNFFLGIRTPWTLSSEYVWRRTHRLGGVCFVWGGILLMISALLPAAQSLMSNIIFGIFTFVILLPVAYSFFIYKKQQK
ncbi:MAG: SdpI family protein [Candidatus Cloacimonadales bacterium]